MNVHAAYVNFCVQTICVYSVPRSDGSKALTPKRRRPLPSRKIPTRKLLSRPEFISGGSAAQRFRMPLSWRPTLTFGPRQTPRTRRRVTVATMAAIHSKQRKPLLSKGSVFQCRLDMSGGVCNDRCHGVSPWPAIANCLSFHSLVRSLSLSW